MQMVTPEGALCLCVSQNKNVFFLCQELIIIVAHDVSVGKAGI